MAPPRDKKTLLLTAGKCVLGGDCLAVHEGKTCFIEGAIPGEKVEALVLQEKKDLLRARVLRVLEPSPQRIQPVCPHVALCGGCQYQHMEYEEELRWKEAQVRETLEKTLGAGNLVQSILRGPKSYGYRRSATFHAVGGGRGKMPSFAYIGKDNVSAIQLKQCDLLDPALEKMIVSVPMNAAGKIGYKMAASGQVVDDRKESFFRVTLSGKTFLAHSQSFFQNNWEVTELIAARIRGWVEETSPETFFDLYAGVGTFSFLCADKAQKIVAIEESRQAVSALKMNREEKKWQQMEIFQGRVERLFVSSWEKHGGENALVFLDPPRQGMEKGLVEYLARSVRAKAIAYVSCDPATFARDLKTLVSGGAWRLQSVVPYDMFPRTKHVEAAALLLYKES